MSGVFRKIFNYFFPREDSTERRASYTPSEDDSGNDWSESKPTKTVDGDAILDDWGGLCEESDSKNPRKSKYISFGHRKCAQPEDNLKSFAEYQWKYGTGEFTDSIVKAVGLEKSGKEYGAHEDACEGPTNDVDPNVEDDVKDGDQSSTESKQDFNPEANDPLKSSPILPELSSDESDSDDTVQLDDAVCEDKTLGDETDGDVEDSSRPWSCQIDDRQDPAPLPSMPDLNSPQERVIAHMMTVIPMDETPSSGGGDGYLGASGIPESFIVVSGTQFVTPVNQNRAIEAGQSSLMSEGKLPEGKHPSPQRPCGNKIKKLMDVKRYSTLHFGPDSNPPDTPPSSPISMSDMAFHSAKSSSTRDGYGSTGAVSSTSRIPGSPCYTVRPVNPLNPGAVASSPNRKFVLVKCKDKSDLSKFPVGSTIKYTPRQPAIFVKKRQERQEVNKSSKGVFATPKSSSTKSAPKTVSEWPRTPRPAEKVPGSLLARMAGIDRGKQEEGRAKSSQAHFTPSHVASQSKASKMSSNVTSRDGKRSGSDLNSQGPSKKAKLGSHRSAPIRPLRSRIPSSILNSPRSMRTRNPSVTYKS
ncbi:uncharacterized protein LOC124164092 [Ischnura elegans]|uniref:uncharacterized protein LOC124164092 n=1 Tax=Ischnura elegans TaxID=197161 RepID=UPI001ED891CE|nr:uncharacterized protein LOC124164092 [Ischnura elegans]